MSITPSTITAATAVATATEGTDGIASYLLSTPLAAATTVQVSLSGWGATAADYAGFYYTVTTASGTSSLTAVAPDGTLALPTGTLSFTLSTHLSTDALTENNESVVFVVSQTAASANITNSWWVQSQINIADAAAAPPPAPAPGPAPAPAPAPAPLTPATITAVTPVATVTEGNDATAGFHLSTALGAATTVNASLSGWGATAADYTGFFYTTTVGLVTSNPTAVAPDGTIALPAGTTDFTLLTHLATDTLAETNESVVFVVSQTAASTNIANSWWVQSQVSIADPVAAPVPAPAPGPAPAPAPAPITPATITASNPVATVTEGFDASASFHLSTALGAATTVNASLSGWGATAADYTGFFYATVVGGVTGSLAPVAPDGTIALPAGTTDFTLLTQLNTDALAETNESVVFVVSQTGASANIANSWWVQSQVNIADPVAAPPPAPGPAPAPAPAPLTPATITAANPVATASEGSDASASYHLSTPLAAATTVNASLSGWGATAADYAGLFYTTTVGGVTSGPLSVAPDGTVNLPTGTTDFTLSTHLATDGLAENNESVVFVVSQTAASANISNSWWVQSLVNIADALAVTTFTGGPGSDSFTGTAGPDVFVIPADTSRAITGQFDIISSFGAGDHIDLPAGVNLASFATTQDWTANGEAALVSALQSVNGLGFVGGVGAVIKYTVGSDAYLAVDSNLNGTIEYGSGSNQDLFIKIVGGASLAVTDLA